MNDFFRFIPLIAVAVVAANVAVLYARANRLSARTPEKRSGYQKLVRTFALYFGGLTVVWAVGVSLGIAGVFAPPVPVSVMVPRSATVFDWCLLAAWALVLTRFSVWLYRQDGAAFLVAHGDLFDTFPRSALGVKVLWACMLTVGAISAIHQFSV